MKGKAILLATIMVVSMAVAGIGGASAASTADSAQESTQQTPVQPQENTTNATPQLGGDDGEDDSDLPQPVDVPPSQLKNGTLDRSSVPERLENADGGGYSAGATSGASSKSDPSSAQYNPTAPELTWFGYDGTGQVGSTYYLKNYTLMAVSDHSEVWVANNLSWPKGDSRPTPEVSERQAEYLASEFESNIYPNETEYFRKPDFNNGTESPLYGEPGPNGTLPDDYYHSSDNESRTVLLVDNIRDQNYYNSSYPVFTAGLSSPTVDDYTDRNVAFIDAANWDNRLGGPNAPWKPENDPDNSNYSIEGTTAHEYQHILHGDADANEESWINEGFSDFAIYISGYGLDRGHINAYLDNPSNSLTTWGDQGQAQILRDYGGAFLFQLYGNEQYGTEFTKAIFNDESNGIQGVKDALNQTGADRNFYQLYQDFSTMLVTDGMDTSANGRYQLEVADLDTNTGHDVAYTRNNRTAAWGNAYNPLDTNGAVDALNVSGIDYPGSTPWTTTEDPTGDSNDQVLYSGSGNGLDNFAIFNASLGDTESPTLNFDTYYQIEKGFDYGFVQVSTDGGDTWHSLSNNNTTSYRGSPTFINPTVKANRPGFTGISGGNVSKSATNYTDAKWVNEQFDLSNYTDDGNVLIGFRYVTDPANTKPGFYVRNISVSDTDISYDGSSTEPFQSLREAQQNYLRYQFSLLGIGDDGSTEVQHYDPTEFENGNTSLSPLLDGEYNRTLLTATWAPDPEETGTVPYDYDVGTEGDSEPPAGENTLTIRGTGEPAEYTLSVTDSLEKSTANDANINSNDEIRRGYVGDGQVGISADSYTFDGTLETIHVSGDAEVYLNGRQLSDEKIASMRNNVIEVAGTGSAADYDFAATDSGTARLEKVTANNANRNTNDEVWRTTGNGQVGVSKDAYGFDGTIDSLDLNGGNAEVYVNGRQVNPDNEQDNMITVVGTGERANYEFTTTGSIAPSTANYANTNSNDVIDGMTKTGQVGISADSNDYNGEITGFSADGDVKIYVDGEQVDQDEVGS